MPQPVYIICSLSGAEDKHTGLLSHFDIVEKFQITRIPTERKKEFPITTGPTFRMVAVWMQTSEDSPDQEFEYETVLFMPPDNKQVTANQGRFSFSKPLHRFVMSFVGIPIEGPGLMYLEHRVRSVDSDAWLKQKYPIFLEEVSSTSEAE